MSDRDEFDPDDLNAISMGLEQHIWFVMDDLESSIRALRKTDPKWGKQAVDKACGTIAALAADEEPEDES